MSTKVDIGKPITCNDKPVEVLTGWVCSKELENDKVCLVYWDGWYAPMNQEGELYCFEEEGLTASNVAPPKNLVKLGDKVTKRGTNIKYTVIAAKYINNVLWLWVQDNHNQGGSAFTAFNFTLNGLPIEGVRK